MRHEQFDHGPLVESWLKEPTFLTDTDLERVSRLVHETPQRRSWVPPLGDTRFKTMISATAMAAGVAAIALSGSVLLDGFLSQDQAPEQLPAAEASVTALTSPAIETTEPEAAETPAVGDGTPGVQRGTFDTPAGPASWVRLSGAYGDVPRLQDAVPWNGGVAIWDAGWHAGNGDEGGGLWETTDGIEWQKAVLPIEPVMRDDGSANLVLSHVGDVALLFQPQRQRLWRSTDDGGWVELDTSAVSESQPTGWWSSEPSLHDPQLVDGQLSIEVEWIYRLPRQQLGLPRQAGGRVLERLNDGRYVLCNPERATCNANDAPTLLRFKETGDGLVVRDDRTGERLGRLAGADASELYTGWGAQRSRGFRIEGDVLVPIGMPADGPIEPTAPEQPADEPADAPADWVESHDGAWLSHEVSPDNKYVVDASWLYLGDGWIDLGQAGYPALRGYISGWSAASVGDITVLWVAEPPDQGDFSSLWFITAPDSK